MNKIKEHFLGNNTIEILSKRDQSLNNTFYSCFFSLLTNGHRKKTFKHPGRNSIIDTLIYSLGVRKSVDYCDFSLFIFKRYLTHI